MQSFIDEDLQGGIEPLEIFLSHVQLSGAGPAIDVSSSLQLLHQMGEVALKGCHDGDEDHDKDISER